MTSLPDVPCRRSGPAVPVIVHGFERSGGVARGDVRLYGDRDGEAEEGESEDEDTYAHGSWIGCCARSHDPSRECPC